MHAMGTIHQGVVGKYAGNQCTVIALFALAAAFLHPVSLWQSQAIGTAIISGNLAYTNYIDQQHVLPYHLAQDELASFSTIPVRYPTFNSFISYVHLVNTNSGAFYGVIGH